MTSRWLAAGAALTLVAAGAATSAQTQPAPNQNPSPTTTQQTAPSQAQMPPSRTRAGRMLHDRVEQRIAELHRRLRITADEEPQWNAFAGTMRDNAVRMDQAFAGQSGDMTHATALQSLQGYAQLAEQHAQDVQRLVPLFTALYNSMPDEQKRETDQVFRDFARRESRNHS